VCSDRSPVAEIHPSAGITLRRVEESQERRRTIELKSRREGSDRSARTQHLGRRRNRRRLEPAGPGAAKVCQIDGSWVRGNVTRALPRSSDATTACPHAVEHNAVEHPARAHWRIVRAIVTIDRSRVAIPQGRAGSAGAREASVNPDTSGPARSANVEAGQDPGWLPGFSGMLSSVC